MPAAPAKGGLSHSGLLAIRFRDKSICERAIGEAKSRASISNCLELAVVPAQCHLRPSHQKVRAILRPIRLAG